MHEAIKSKILARHKGRGGTGSLVSLRRKSNGYAYEILDDKGKRLETGEVNASFVIENFEAAEGDEVAEVADVEED